MTTDDVVAVRGAVKTYGAVRALDGLDLSVRRGEVHGFLGPNGAGKSTTIRALLGLHRLDAGEVEVLGRDPWREPTAVRRQLAYVPGDVSLWPTLSGGEAVDLLIRLRGADPARTRRDELLEAFELDPTRKGDTYSKGNRQKVALVAALSADVPLLVLDEPTSGLDPLMETVFAREVRRWASEGRTVLLSSHILSEVEQLCERVTIVRDGRVAEDAPLEQLRRSGRTRIGADLDAPVDLRTTPGVHELVQSGARVDCTVEPDAVGAVVSVLARGGVRSLTATPPSLEEVFLDAYRGDR